MPSYIINDTLQSYSLGPGLPTGFDSLGTFVSEFDQTASPGLAGKTGIYYRLFGNVWYPSNTFLGGTLVTATSVFWEVLGGINAGPGSGTGTFIFDYVNPVSFTGSTPIQVIFENDGTVSVAVTGATKVNSFVPVVQNGVWMYCQLNLSVGSITILGVTYLTFAFQLAVNGQVVINETAPIISAITVDPSVGVGINRWKLNTGLFGELVFTSGLEAIPFYPNPGSAIYNRNSQLVVETIQMNQFRQGRISQLAMELIKAPNSRNARISQIIVELILKNGSIKSGGFHVIES